MDKRGRAAFAATIIGTACWLPSSAEAEWFRVSTSNQGSVYSIDPDRLKTVGGRRQVWMKGDHARNRGERARSSMTLLSYDCSAATVKALAESSYDSFGKTITSRSFPDYGVGYQPIVPETVAETISKIVCRTNGEGE